MGALQSTMPGRGTLQIHLCTANTLVRSFLSLLGYSLAIQYTPSHDTDNNHLSNELYNSVTTPWDTIATLSRVNTKFSNIQVTVYRVESWVSTLLRNAI
jgi:hypothetical protein